VPFAEGIARSVAWFAADPERQVVDARDAALDRIVAAYEAAWSGQVSSTQPLPAHD
jgi:hypothetical protein